MYARPATQTIEQAVHDLHTVELDRPVGSPFEYTDSNYFALGSLIEAISQEPYGVYIQRHIFEPLEMWHSDTSQDQAQRDGMATGYRYWFGVPLAFDGPYFRANLPAGFIISSAEDLSHYLAMYLNHGHYHGKDLLSPAGIAQMQSPPRGCTYGMGWQVGQWGGVPAIYHDGNEANFSSTLVLVPRGGFGIIVLENVHGAVASLWFQAIPQRVTGLVAGGQGEDATNSGTYSLLFDLAVVVALTMQIWSLLRLPRHRCRLEFPLRCLLHALGQGRRWVLPLLWELAWPVAILLALPAQLNLNWQALVLVASDVIYSLFVISGVFLLTGLVQVVKSGLSLRAWQPEVSEAPSTRALPRTASAGGVMKMSTVTGTAMVRLGDRQRAGLMVWAGSSGLQRPCRA